MIYGTAYPKQFRGMDAENPRTPRPSGRAAAGYEGAGATTAVPVRRHPPFRQSGPVHAPPDQQAYPATLPQ